jgi:hypothetical protein
MAADDEQKNRHVSRGEFIIQIHYLASFPEAVIMKMSVGVIAAIIFIIAMVFVYLRIGKKGAEETKAYIENTAGYIDQARQSVDEMNKNIEETKKAADRMMGN